MSATHTQDFQLGPWTVQPSLHRLCDGETTCQVSHKVMAVLLHLAAEPGRVVSKDELVQEIWQGAFTSDEALTTVIYELRKTLCDDARQPRYVETIRKGGYRLVAPVIALGDPLTTESPTAPTTVPDPAAPIEQTTHRWPGWAPSLAGWVALASVFALLALHSPRAFDGAARQPSTIAERAAAAEEPTAIAKGMDAPAVPPGPFEPETPAPPPSLAVLPLTSFGDQCRQDSFAGGLTEMLIADLAASSPFEVLPSLTTRGIDEAWSLEEVAAKIDADLVVEGTVVRAGERIWLSVQLVEIASGRMVWGGTYERLADDSLDQQRALAIEIAEELGRQALPALIWPEAPQSPLRIEPAP